MDGFSYNNIFETKGIEYLIIIAFLVMIIPFWIVINKQSIKKRVKKTMGILSENILRIPQGIFYNKNHTWTYLERTGSAKVGMDDFLLHITGEIRIAKLKNPGDMVTRGEVMAEVVRDGKNLKIMAPLSGKIIETNTDLLHTPAILNEDPYGRGYVYKIKPDDWIGETSSYYLAQEAVAWAGKELIRFKDFLAVSLLKNSPGSSVLILQDGGELCDQPLSELPDEVWQDFQKTFLI